ncbi:MAG: carboxypeptidase-like regulatory domain-containing protein [Bacteroidales bacterium]|nr:carboxypeptidase-like regulatory domain-containing protein [Bacteroidales bacterium]
MKTTILKKAGLAILGMLVLFSQLSTAQEDYYTIKGKVKDKESKKEVIFGSVSIAGTHIGTVTNGDGEFAIKIKKSMNNGELEFSHIGYNSTKVAIIDLKPEDNLIYLVPSSVNVNEVTVRPEDARKLISMAISKIPENYSITALNSTGFYREAIKKRRDYLSISEALVDIYKGGYTRDIDDDKVKIYKGRKSSNVKRADTLAVKLQGGPYISLLFDVVKNPYVLISDDVIYQYDFAITDIKTVDNKLMYEVSFTPRVTDPEYPLYTGKYFIDVKSLAIASAEFSMDLSDPEKAARMFVKRKPSGLKLTPTSTNYIVTYKEINGKYYFNYSRSEVDFKCNWAKRLFNTNYTIMSELAITDWNMATLDKFKMRESLKKNSVFEEEVTAFTDDNFWGEFNTIEPDQSIESAIKKYGRKLKREKN